MKRIMYVSLSLVLAALSLIGCSESKSKRGSSNQYYNGYYQNGYNCNSQQVYYDPARNTYVDRTTGQLRPECANQYNGFNGQQCGTYNGQNWIGPNGQVIVNPNQYNCNAGLTCQTGGCQYNQTYYDHRGLYQYTGDACSAVYGAGSVAVTVNMGGYSVLRCTCPQIYSQNQILTNATPYVFNSARYGQVDGYRMCFDQGCGGGYRQYYPRRSGFRFGVSVGAAITFGF